MPTHRFPADFIWGTATSAYQVEGSPLADGAGPSIWHTFSHQPGKIANGDNGDVACDHYHRFLDDVAMMRELGIRSYRFSISWSRVLPQGTGKVNQPGLDFYNRLVDALLANGIEPMATLYHWDLPQALEDRGGWANPESVHWFTEYAELMYRSLDDRIKLWATFNEPWVTFDQGYVEGHHAPGRRDWAEAAAVSKHLLLAHGAGVAAYRALGKHQIGLVVNLTPVTPASEREADRDAVRRHNAYLNEHFLDPPLLGQIPPELPAMFGDAWPTWTAKELQAVHQPIDFVGVNYYLRIVMCDDPAAGPSRARVVNPPDRQRTAMGWEIYAPGLRDTLEWVSTRYGNPPIFITENGAAFDDVVAPDGHVHDPRRVQYLHSHLRAAQEAIQSGARLRGYYLWSLLDNFEWAAGYSKRFGIVHVDHGTQRRVIKDSARFYSDVIRSNGGSLGEK